MKLVGMGTVTNNIKNQVDNEIPRKIRNAINLCRLKVENDARRMAPKDTGALKASMWSEMLNDTEARVGDGVHYGIYQEKGTARFPPQPFLIPALEMHKKDLEKELKRITE